MADIINVKNGKGKNAAAAAAAAAGGGGGGGSSSGGSGAAAAASIPVKATVATASAATINAQRRKNRLRLYGRQRNIFQGLPSFLVKARDHINSRAVDGPLTLNEITLSYLECLSYSGTEESIVESKSGLRTPKLHGRCSSRLR